MRSHYAWQLGTPSRVYIPSLLQLAQKTQQLDLWEGSCRRVVRSFKKHLYFTQPPTIDSYTECPQDQHKTLCKLLGLFISQKLGCEGPQPGRGQTSRTSSGRRLRCGPLRPWLAGPDWMSGLVPAERVRSFLENLIHQFGQNQ